MTSIRTLAAAGAVVALASVIAPGTGAYTTSGYKWPTNSVSMFVNPANSDVSQSAAIAAIQAGMNAWNSQAGTPFRWVYSGQTNTSTTGYDGKNVIMFRNQDNGGTIASAYWWYSNGVLVDSDIVFWDGGWTFYTGQSGCNSGAYIEDIATHELGHSLGLRHSSQAEATMYPSYSRCSQSLRTLSSDDMAGAQSLYGKSGGTTDTAPVVTIVSPSNGSSTPAGALITFSGSATDVPDGDASDSLVWTSNIDGQIGTGAQFSKALKAGSHTITATASDSKGQTTKKSVSLTVTSTTNAAPSVTITTPVNGATVPEGTSVSFAGSASDPEDGSLTSKMAWKSNLEGQIGIGGSFSRTMKAGSHTITATVTDAGGLTAQRSVTLNVSSSTPPPTTPKLSVRAYKDKGLQKADLSWSNLTATSVDVYRGSAKIATTANDGSHTDPIDSRGGGSYSYKVCASGTSTCTNQASASF